MEDTCEPPVIHKLPAAMRALLLDLLALGYPQGYPQSRLHDAPDAAVSWQAMTMLEDYADIGALS